MMHDHHQRWMLIAQYQSQIRAALVRYFPAGTLSQIVNLALFWTSFYFFLKVKFPFIRKLPGPLYVYYEISNFYQNDRRYLKSTSTKQLLGKVRRLIRWKLFSWVDQTYKLLIKIWLFVQVLEYDDVASSCYPLIENGTNLLNPCGLIANSLFNGNYYPL